MPNAPANVPLPIGIDTDNSTVLVRDLRGEDYVDPLHVLQTCLVDVEAKIHKNMGWDGPDFFGVMLAGGMAEDGSATDYLWTSELDVPQNVYGKLMDILQGLAAVFGQPNKTVHDAVVRLMLGKQPIDASPLAVVASFEALTLPDRRTSRHTIFYYLNHHVTHMLRIEDEPPQFLAINEPADADAGSGPDHDFIFGGLGMVAAQFAQHFQDTP